MLIFANVLPFITEYCDTEHIVKLAFAIYSKTSKSLVAEGFYCQNKEQMFTIRGRLVCLTIRVRPSTQDVDELARPHFVYTYVLGFDLRVDNNAYENYMPMGKHQE